MFENIIGQPGPTGQLRSDIEGDRLPGSILFEGPPSSAKLSAALELARVVSCEGDAAWNCACSHCAAHRSLTHQDILILGPKSFGPELKIGAGMLGRSPGTASRYFFMRALRKLLRRFDAELYGGEESKLSKALPLVRSAIEAMEMVSPQGAASDIEAAEAAEKLLPICLKLEDLVPSSVPVFQVRSMERWVRLAPLGAKKLVVIEHADTMAEAPRNALLKLLEEPPPRAIFALTSSRPRAIIPTILSRVRRYRFSQRSESDSRAVIERVFREKAPQSASIAGYFDSFRSAHGDELARAARLFAGALVSARLARAGQAGIEPPLVELSAGSPGVAEAIALASTATSGFGAGDDSRSWTFPAFLDAVGKEFAGSLRKPGAGLETQRMAERYRVLSRDAAQRLDSYNLQGQALAERLADAFTRG